MSALGTPEEMINCFQFKVTARLTNHQETEEVKCLVPTRKNGPSRIKKMRTIKVKSDVIKGI
jgi:hypothetical protein